METVRLWSYEPITDKSDLLPVMPQALQVDVELLIKLIEKVDLCVSDAHSKNAQSGGTFLNFIFYNESQKLEFFESVSSAVKELMQSDDPESRIRIALRLWSGCLSSAKSLSLRTNDGPNNETIRRIAFQDIDIKCKKDRVYQRGVELSPLFKAQRNQSEDVSFNGAEISWVTLYKDIFQEINKNRMSLENQYLEYVKKCLSDIKKKESQPEQ